MKNVFNKLIIKLWYSCHITSIFNTLTETYFHSNIQIGSKFSLKYGVCYHSRKNQINVFYYKYKSTSNFAATDSCRRIKKIVKTH